MKKNILLFLISSLLFLQCKSDVDEIETLPELNDNITIYNQERFLDGYTLIAPVTSKSTYLIDMEGYVVKKWTSNNLPLSVYLNEDGTLIRSYKTDNPNFLVGGKTGGIEMFDFEGNIIWDWQYSTENYILHHDLSVLPNGHILATVWDKKNASTSINNGRNPNLLLDDSVLAERIIEVKPIGSNNAEIIWEWSIWNHLIQDYDSTKLNYGNISEHPDLIDINFTNGYSNLSHFNSIFYIEELDQIVVSSRKFNELMIIDHSTTSTEAASTTGGNYNKGGRLLYRWGNPLAYKSGTIEDQKLFGQHDVRYMNNTTPTNGGNFLIFNNNISSNMSSVVEILIPQNTDGSYNLLPNSNNLPLDYSWSYQSTAIYAPRVSGAQRLSNYNTLITRGTEGRIIEIDINKTIVWQYDIPLEVNDVFKSYRYAKNYPAFENQDLSKLNIEIE
ncbi:aryl-sulfate sulfotransferase [Winogradskyella sp. PC D3.3]